MENTFGKGGNTGNQHFLLFSSCFLHYQREILSFYQHLICRLQTFSIWLHPNSCCLVQGYFYSKELERASNYLEFLGNTAQMHKAEMRNIFMCVSRTTKIKPILGVYTSNFTWKRC